MKDLASELVCETISLLINDFEQFEINIKFSGNFNSAYQDIMKQLIPQTERLLNNQYYTLLNLLYKIDVNENKIKKLQIQNPQINFSELLAHLILEREWQKALTRRYFKDKENGFEIKNIEHQFIPQLKR